MLQIASFQKLLRDIPTRKGNKSNGVCNKGMSQKPLHRLNYELISEMANKNFKLKTGKISQFIYCDIGIRTLHILNLRTCNRFHYLFSPTTQKNIF